MASLETLSNSMITAQALNNLILVWPQQKTGYQPESKLFGGKTGTDERFLFDYEGDNTITLSSEITDHYVEDNYAVQDHIALAPEVITTQGFVAEVNNNTNEASPLIKDLANKLGDIAAFDPQLSISAQRAYNQAFRAYQTLAILKRSAVAAWSNIAAGKVQGPTEISPGLSTEQFVEATNNFSTQNRQQIAFQKFYGYRKNRTLFTVQTPWAIFKNCAIQEIVATQDATTRFVSSFQVTFKPILTSQTATVDATDAFQGRLSAQASEVVSSGNNSLDTEQLSFSQILDRTA